MKRNLLLITLSVVASIGVFAQDYVPFLREDVRWQHEAVESTTGISHKFYYQIIGDTVINDMAYKKMYVVYEEKTPADNMLPIAFLREDVYEKKVYARNNNDWNPTDPCLSCLRPYFGEGETEELLYDFGDIENPDQYRMTDLYFTLDGFKQSDVTFADGTQSRVHVGSAGYVGENVYNNAMIVEGVGYVGGYWCDILNKISEENFIPSSSGCYPRFLRLEDLDGNLLYEAPHLYKQLVREGVKWQCELTKYDPNTGLKIYPYDIEIKGDTVINDVTYKKCYYNFEDKSYYASTTPEGYLRENIASRRVYSYIPEDQREILLYDFMYVSNPELPYIYETHGESEYFATSEVVVNGEACTSYDLYDVYNPDQKPLYHIIESVGYVTNPSVYGTHGDLLHCALQRIVGMSAYTIIDLVRLVDAAGNVLYESPQAGVPEVEQDYADALSVKIVGGEVVVASSCAVNSISLIDMSGREVLTGTGDRLSIAGAAPGVYVLKVSTADGITTKKLVF